MGCSTGGGGGAAASSLANGAAFRVCRFVVKGTGRQLQVPYQLSPLEWRPAAEVVNRDRPRQFGVSMAMMRWVLNGEPFEMMGLAANEHIKLGVTDYVLKDQITRLPLAIRRAQEERALREAELRAAGACCWRSQRSCFGRPRLTEPPGRKPTGASICLAARFFAPCPSRCAADQLRNARVWVP